MRINKSFKFSYSFWNICEQMPRPRWPLPHLQKKIKQNKAQKLHTWVCTDLQTTQTLQRELKTSDSLTDISQVSQKVLSPRLLLLNFTQVFTAYSRNRTHFMHYGVLEIHTRSLFLPLKRVKNISPAKQRLYSLYWYIRAQFAILSDTGSCRNKELH